MTDRLVRESFVKSKVVKYTTQAVEDVSDQILRNSEELIRISPVVNLNRSKCGEVSETRRQKRRDQ